MAVPVDVAKIAAFDQEHQTPQEVIKEMRTNLDLMNKIIRTNVLENQQEMKTVFNEKVTPYYYKIGSVVLFNNPVEKVGQSGKLRRHWVSPYTIVWLDSHRCKLVNHITGKQVNNLVHINRIKPYFYRDEIPDDPITLDDEAAVALEDTLIEVPEPEKVALPRKTTSKGRGRARGSGKTKKVVMPDNEQVGVPTTTGTPSTSRRVSELLEVPSDSSDVENTPDFDIMFEAECILKQRNQKGGRREFLVRWADKNLTDTWTKEDDLSDDLLLHWWSTHTRRGTLRKNLSISLLHAPGPWAYKRGWNTNSTDSSEEIDQYGNEL